MRPTPRELLRKAGLKALLVSNPVNVRYLTHIPAEDAVLLVLPSAFVLFVNPLEREMVEHAASSDVRVLPAKDIEHRLKRIPLCGIEGEHVSVARLNRWKKMFSRTKFVNASGAIEYFRRSKDEDELKKMIKANRITEELLRRIPSALKLNVTEREVAWDIETWTRELGGDGMAFKTIVAFGKNSSKPHHRPSGKKLLKGEIVQIDLGAVYKGYCSDRSEVFFTAKKTPEQEKIYSALMEAKNAAIEHICAGASVRELDRISREVLKKYNLEQYFTHSLGHGVGIDIHEGVNLSSRAPDDHLLHHEVITIEPGVYIPGKFGMRLEEMIVVT